MAKPSITAKSTNGATVSSAALIMLFVVLAALAGIGASLQVTFIGPFLGIATLAVVAALGSKLITPYMALLAIVVAGYAAQSRSFAYIGVAPIYVSEVILALGLLIFPFSKRHAKFSLIQWLIVLFILAGVVRTLPYVDSYGLQAFRDSAIYYYSLFAILVSTLITADHLRGLGVAIARISPILVIWILIMSLFLYPVQDSIPHLPGSPVPIISVVKPGDRAVTLAAIGAFVLSGWFIFSGVKWKVPSWLFWSAWIASAGVAMVSNRGGMIALVAGLGLLAALAPRREWNKLIITSLTAILLLLIVDPTVDIGRNRVLSIDQIAANIISIFEDEDIGQGSLQGTKEWRLNWWNDIYQDIVVGGNGIWQGHGFGLNLATHYGYQTDPEGESLRSPHSIHMTILARMGVTGLLIWIAIIVLTFALLLRTHALAKKNGARLIEYSSLWILATLVAAIANGSFDVYLESPYGAIPFWCLVGIAIALPRLINERSSC